MKIRFLIPLLLFALIAAACGGAETLVEDVSDIMEDAVEETVEENSDIVGDDDAEEPADEAEGEEEAMEDEEEVVEEEPAETATTEAPAAEEDPPAEEEPAEEVEGAVATEIDGQALYESNCTRCHGAEGQGGRGPSLQGIAVEQPDQTDGINQVINGGGGMPAFGESLTIEEIEATIDYIWETF